MARHGSAGMGQPNTFCWAGVWSRRAAGDLNNSVHLRACGLAQGNSGVRRQSVASIPREAPMSDAVVGGWLLF